MISLVRIKSFLALIILSSFILSACSGPERRGKPRGRKLKPVRVVSGMRKVVRVIDGDTFVLNGGDKVRLIYVNTPEKREELGAEAKAFARKMLDGRKVRIEGRKRDAYGRLLADVYVKGKSFAVEITRAGLAHLFIIPPFDRDKTAAILAAQKEARDANRGIWGTARYQGLFHITSFHADPWGNDNMNLNGEAVRIACVGVEPASLKGYKLHNKRGEYYEFPDLVMPPGHTVLVHSGHGTDQLDPKRQMRVYWKRVASAWTNKQDAATLRDADDGLVDESLHMSTRRGRRK